MVEPKNTANPLYLDAKAMQVNYERSPHSARKVIDKAYQKTIFLVIFGPIFPLNSSLYFSLKGLDSISFPSSFSPFLIYFFK